MAAEDVNDETAKQLRASLSEGVLAGEGQLRAPGAGRGDHGQRQHDAGGPVAHVRGLHAQSYGDIQAWTQSGLVEAKEWYTAHG